MNISTSLCHIFWMVIVVKCEIIKIVSSCDDECQKKFVLTNYLKSNDINSKKIAPVFVCENKAGLIMSGGVNVSNKNPNLIQKKHIMGPSNCLVENILAAQPQEYKIFQAPIDTSLSNNKFNIDQRKPPSIICGVNNINSGMTYTLPYVSKVQVPQKTVTITSTTIKPKTVYITSTHVARTYTQPIANVNTLTPQYKMVIPPVYTNQSGVELIAPVYYNMQSRVTATPQTCTTTIMAQPSPQLIDVRNKINKEEELIIGLKQQIEEMKTNFAKMQQDYITQSKPQSFVPPIATLTRDVTNDYIIQSQSNNPIMVTGPQTPLTETVPIKIKTTFVSNVCAEGTCCKPKEDDSGSSKNKSIKKRSHRSSESSEDDVSSNDLPRMRPYRYNNKHIKDGLTKEREQIGSFGFNFKHKTSKLNTLIDRLLEIRSREKKHLKRHHDLSTEGDEFSEHSRADIGEALHLANDIGRDTHFVDNHSLGSKHHSARMASSHKDDVGRLQDIVEGLDLKKKEDRLLHNLIQDIDQHPMYSDRECELLEQSYLGDDRLEGIRYESNGEKTKIIGEELRKNREYGNTRPRILPIGIHKHISSVSYPARDYDTLGFSHGINQRHDRKIDLLNNFLKQHTIDPIRINNEETTHDLVHRLNDTRERTNSDLYPPFHFDENSHNRTDRVEGTRVVYLSDLLKDRLKDTI